MALGENPEAGPDSDRGFLREELGNSGEIMYRVHGDVGGVDYEAVTRALRSYGERGETLVNMLALQSNGYTTDVYIVTKAGHGISRR